MSTSYFNDFVASLSPLTSGCFSVKVKLTLGLFYEFSYEWLPSRVNTFPLGMNKFFKKRSFTFLIKIDLGKQRTSGDEVKWLPRTSGCPFKRD